MGVLDQERCARAVNLEGPTRERRRKASDGIADRAARESQHFSDHSLVGWIVARRPDASSNQCFLERTAK
jgi:hypothetical protein